MVRAYKMKGQKRKKIDKFKFEEKPKQIEEEEAAAAKRLKMDDGTGTNEDKVEESIVNHQLAGIPIAPSDENNNNNNNKLPGIVFILEKASLEVAKVGKTEQLLNSEDHANFLMKHNKNPADYRPDIAHQAITMILDSRLNKAGRLKALYVRTEKGVLFEINPRVRIPRTFKRFSGLMLQLLQKMSITASSSREKLMKAIKNPVTQYLPVNSRKIGFSHSSEKLVDIQDYVNAVDDKSDLVFVVGAMAHGKIDMDYVDDYLSVSNYPLSAAYCITMITGAIERKWKIL